MESSELLFSQYKPMILGRAYDIARKYSVDQEDVVSEGYLVFVQVLKKFDERKAKFSTFLWINLEYHLDEYCRLQRGWDNNIFETEEEFDNWLSDTRIDTDDFDTKFLTDEARFLLKFILSRRWECAGSAPHKPTYSFIERTFYSYGWRKCEIYKIWRELKSWWNEMVA